MTRYVRHMNTVGMMQFTQLEMNLNSPENNPKNAKFCEIAENFDKLFENLPNMICGWLKEQI